MKINYIIGFLIFVSSGFVQAKDSEYCSSAGQDLAAGDLVFISNHNYLFRQVEKDTQTWASHVGIAFKNEKNNKLKKNIDAV